MCFFKPLLLLRQLKLAMQHYAYQRICHSFSSLTKVYGHKYSLSVRFLTEFCFSSFSTHHIYWGPKKHPPSVCDPVLIAANEDLVLYLKMYHLFQRTALLAFFFFFLPSHVYDMRLQPFLLTWLLMNFCWSLLFSLLLFI